MAQSIPTVFQRTSMDNLQPPPPMCFEGNIKENWEKFKKRFNRFMEATGGKTMADKVQVATFLHVIGEEGQDIFDTFELSIDQQSVMGNVVAAFEAYCVPKANETVNRYVFNSRKQHENESFDAYLSDLKLLCLECAYGELKSSMLRDAIVSGVRDKNLKERLFREESLTLDKCIQMCKSAELSQERVKTFSKDSEAVNYAKSKKPEFRKQQSGMKNNFNSNKQFPGAKPKEKGGTEDSSSKVGQQPSQSKQYFGNRFSKPQQQQSFQNPCKRCGRRHAFRSCPAFGQRCNKCSRIGHFAAQCQAKVAVVDSQPMCNDSFFIGSIQHGENNNSGDWYETLSIENKLCKFKLDTGADCNLILASQINHLNLQNCVQLSDCKVVDYNGSPIDVRGKCSLLCETTQQKTFQVEFYVTTCNNGPPVLGLPTIKRMNLLQRVNSIRLSSNLQPLYDEYTDLFKGLGCIKNIKCEIKLKNGALGHIEPCRQVPLKLLEPLKQELAEMESQGVVMKVDQPTEWVSSLVIVKKPDGSIRICLDPQNLNSCILREHYKLPTFDEISAKMKGAKRLTILDANKAFWQIKLGTESCLFTTFGTPFGRYCFKRLPYGICSAPEIFHKNFSQIFDSCEGVQVYIDDIIIWGSSDKEHDARLQKVFECARAYGIRFNPDKCKIGVTEVEYLGHKFSETGISMHEGRIKAISTMVEPKNTKELSRFLGMINYVSRFLPNVAQETAPLRALMKKNTVWIWDKVHSTTFSKLKQMLVSDPVLQYFDINEECTISVDSSKDGLGAVLLQKNLPVAYASKSLTDTQKAYAQIEKEMLAIVFGCEKFHQYIYGKRVIIESDHKPLETIFKKSLSNCPMRLQRMRLRLQMYDISVIYKPGKELFLADALSRSFLDDEDYFPGEDFEAHVGLIVENLPISNFQFNRFVTETAKDDELVALRNQMKDSWPISRNEVLNILKPYYNYQDELYEVNGVIFKGNNLVVPKSLRKEMLEKIHYNHLGMEKCKNRAREVLFWPHMTKEIEDLISNCETCLRFQKRNSFEPLINRDVPQRVWETLGADLFEYKGIPYLLVVDYYSKFVDVHKLRNETSECVISGLKCIFSTFGIPQLLYTDGGPCFIAKSFKDFSRVWNFEHSTSSPEYARSNGMVERYVQEMKKLLKKAEYDSKDFYLALLEYRKTPISKDLPSPADIVFQRPVRGLLPNSSDLKKNIDFRDVREKLQQRQSDQKRFHDRRFNKNLIEFRPGDNVYIRRKENQMSKGKVIGKAQRPRSYKVLTENGNVLDRNRYHLYRSTDNNFYVDRNYDDLGSGNFNGNNTDPGSENNGDSQMLEQEHSNENRVVSQENYSTRSGRQVVRPRYLNDYDCS